MEGLRWFFFHVGYGFGLDLDSSWDVLALLMAVEMQRGD